MQLHQTSGRARLGAGLALLTVACWGMLPVVLMLLLRKLDAYTATWFRFVVASGILFVFLTYRGTLPQMHRLTKIVVGLLVIAMLGLAANYLTFLQSLAYISPGTAQVLIQLAPLLLVISSVLIFKERFSRVQRFGMVLLILGLLLFFNRRLVGIFSGADSYGIFLILFAAVAWAFYAIAQKQLLTMLSSQGILLFIYAGSALLFTPAINLPALTELDGLGWFLLLFSSVNTVIAYGAFSESMRHLEATRVSAILSLTPIASLACVALSAAIWPGIVPSENLSILGYLGALLVVGGSALTAIGRSSPAAKKFSPAN